MSQFSTMTTRERKMQAAAICREIQSQEGAEMDLGKKVSVPKDIMLDELSFASNRGSRLFKMRQRRSEKYTYESIQNENNTPLNNIVVCPVENENGTESQCTKNNLGVDEAPNVTSDVTSDMTDTNMVPNPDIIAPGYAGPLKDIPPEKFNSTSMPKLYHSPWEKAIIDDPTVSDTLITGLPEPEPRPELPGYKSFNRVATPFGGFGKAPRPSPVRPVQEEPLPDDLPQPQEDAVLLGRPSFNRSALGWTMSTGPVSVPGVSLEPAFVPESDDL